MGLTAHHIPTSEYDLNLNFKVTVLRPMILSIKGYDSDLTHPNSIYFNREIGTVDHPFKGVKNLLVPMPISPKNLTMLICDAKTKSDEFVKVEGLKALPLQKRITAFNTPADYEFFKFAEEFCKKCGYLSTGIYQSNSGRFEIKISDTIYNHDGTVSTTPARMFRPHGNIEISKKHFAAMTVPMRMMIILHEYCHFRMNTRNEKKADEYALRIYLSMGYPKTEALYAFTKVFTPANDKHAQALLDRTQTLFATLKNAR